MEPSQLWVPLLVSLPLLAIWAYCLVGFARTFERDVHLFDRQTRVLLLVFTNVFRGALWMLRGRRRPPSQCDR